MVQSGQPVFIRIFNEDSVLELWMRNEEGWIRFRDFDICRWSGTLGPKLKEGDHQSPEGFYRVKQSRLNPNGKYHLSFNLGFPNAFDRAYWLISHGAWLVRAYRVLRPDGPRD